MKGGNLLYISGGLLLLMLLLSSNNASANSNINLNALVSQYGSANVQRAQNLLNALSQQGLTALQIQLLMAQCLFETGIFTDSNQNYNATDNLNNWAGISNSDGSLKSYSSISSFLNEYIPLLQKGNDPLDATSVSDFNNRLYANGYYTENPSVYLSGLNTYFNLLSA